MRKFFRLKQPDFLATKWQSWGLSWQKRLATKPGAAFHWHEVNGTRVNHLLLPVLRAQVQDHCSFCDAFPVSPPSNPTIEHFRPKTKFPTIAYKWRNLYFCCDFCQGKGETFDEALLRADAPGFTFDKYFMWDFTTGELKINPKASNYAKNRAKRTIEIYRLNEGHPIFRRLEARKRRKSPLDPIDDFAYRDFVR